MLEELDGGKGRGKGIFPRIQEAEDTHVLAPRSLCFADVGALAHNDLGPPVITEVTRHGYSYTQNQFFLPLPNLQPRKSTGNYNCNLAYKEAHKMYFPGSLHPCNFEASKY